MSPFLFIPNPFPVSSSALPTFSHVPTHSFSMVQLPAGLHVLAWILSNKLLPIFKSLVPAYNESCVTVNDNLS